MRRSLVIPAVVLALLHPSAPLRAQDSAERAVLRLEEHYAHLQTQKDTAEMRRLLDDSFVEVDHHGNVLDKKRRLAGYASSNLVFETVARDDVQVRVYGNAAVFTARSHATGVDNRAADPAQKHFDVWHPLTHVWIRTNGDWRLVSEHNSDIDRRRMLRIGLLSDHEYFGNPISAVDWVGAFRAGLRDAGYVDGRNVTLEFRNGDGDPAKLARGAADLAAMPVDIIVASSTTAAKAAKAATHSIPTVFWSAEPISSGLVADLDHPDANLTGATARDDQQAEFIALLKEVVPGLRKVAILFDRGYAPVPGLLDEAERGARALGLETQLVEVKEPGDLPGAFAAMEREGSRAALALNHGLFYRERGQLAALAIEHGVALSTPYFVNAEAGALIGHEADFGRVWRLNASYVGRLLGGARPRDLPVQRVRLGYAVNVRTARALGLTIPQRVLRDAALVIPDSAASLPARDTAVDVRLLEQLPAASPAVRRIARAEAGAHRRRNTLFTAAAAPRYLVQSPRLRLAPRNIGTCRTKSCAARPQRGLFPVDWG